jgi:Zn-dependent peptidase ImmA (M78 family)
MRRTEELEELIEFYGISLHITPLTSSVSGFYFHDSMGSRIVMNSNIYDANEYRSVLAEELGHHLTTVGDIRPHAYPHSLRNSCNINKQELKAVKWAADFLIPTSELIDYIKTQSSITLDAIMEQFGVSEWLIVEKFRFMAKRKFLWHLDQGRVLVLSNLPSIFVSGD